jgi:hypothetical protein
VVFHDAVMVGEFQDAKKAFHLPLVFQIVPLCGMSFRGGMTGAKVCLLTVSIACIYLFFFKRECPQLTDAP